MKIIDSTIFCNTYEKELLLLKLILEENCVDEWVISECQYDYRGRYKGPIVRQMIEEDERFSPYRDRITVFSLKRPLCEPGMEDRYAGVIDPRPFAEAEWALRDAPTSYLLHKYQGGDRVFTTDVDEMIDFSNPWRRDQLLHHLRSDRPLQFDRVRYIYDFNNRAWRDEWDMVNPAYTIDHLRSGEVKLRDKKWKGDKVGPNTHPLIFEYCFVFPLQGVYDKYNSSLHTHWSKHKIDISLECNHWTKTDYQGDPSLQCRWDWFERVELNERNSPAYVRENLDRLRTHLVPEDYRERRFARYGSYAHFPDNRG